MSAGERLLRLFGGAMLVLVGLLVWLLFAWLGMWFFVDESEFNSIDTGEAIGIAFATGVPTVIGIGLCAIGCWFLAPAVTGRKFAKSLLVKALLVSPGIAACSIAVPTALLLFF